MRTRSYSELRQIDDFEDRYEYLAIHGEVGASTFGFDRYLNQRFYRSTEWRHVRSHIIARDQGCDLGVIGYEIHDRIYIHHMNPMTSKELEAGDESIIDPEFLISTTHRTHNAIHYGDKNLLPKLLVERRPGDTKLW